jgi:hypothetical protein
MVTAMATWAAAVEAIITGGAGDAAITTAGPTIVVIIENPNRRPSPDGLLFNRA